MKSIRTSITRIKIDSANKISSNHFRAFMLKQYADSALAKLSENSKDRKIYSSLLQYKIINDAPFIFAMEDGVDALKEILPELSELYLGHKKYKVIEIIEKDLETEVGVTAKRNKYEFETPWLALNEEDYAKFKYLYTQERYSALSKMIIRNILGFARSFDIEIASRIRVKHELNEIQSFKLGTSTSGFVGKFEINFHIPEHLGIGNLSDRGFGSITPKR
ncbi:MAG: hypothetical protein IIB40_11010 [Candidatus Marinimicrobia bacterium]|nr:hypothetical protein [Candidatus Neomarinimicrobiota bacterium]MCH7954516.1 hypothetical protein [Candidatus Neomarinimicrobiota bacterium]